MKRFLFLLWCTPLLASAQVPPSAALAPAEYCEGLVIDLLQEFAGGLKLSDAEKIVRESVPTLVCPKSATESDCSRIKKHIEESRISVVRFVYKNADGEYHPLILIGEGTALCLRQWDIPEEKEVRNPAPKSPGLFFRSF